MNIEHLLDLSVYLIISRHRLKKTHASIEYVWETLFVHLSNIFVLHCILCFKTSVLWS